MNTIAHSFDQGRITPLTSRASSLSMLQLAKLLRLWSQRASQRRHLITLTARELEDVGISPEAAANEASKWFWQE